MRFVQYLVISGGTGQDALCSSILQEVLRGAVDGGAETQVLSLEGIERCRGCSDDRSVCKTENRCAFGDDGFDNAQKLILQADALCVITPVYLGAMADHLRGYLDRLRRCERGLIEPLADKQILAILSPKDDVGYLSCLEQLDKFCRHTGAVIFDFIGLHRWNSDYQKVSAYSAARSMAFGRKAGMQK